MDNVLFGALSYETHEEYKSFLNGLDPAQSVSILVAAVAYAQGKGVFSMTESEVLVNCVRNLVSTEGIQNISENQSSTQEAPANGSGN